jgi:hypothetical protein
VKIPAALVTLSPGPAAPAKPAASAARCESCGGPSGNGSLCGSCQHAFHAFLPGRSAETQSDLPGAVAETTQVGEARPATDVVQSGDVPQWLGGPDVAVETLPSRVFAEVVTRSRGDVEAGEPEGSSAEAAGEGATGPTAAQTEAARIELARLEAIRLQASAAEAIKEMAARAQAARNKVALIETRRPATKAATLAPASTRSGGSVQSRQGIGSMVRVAAAVAIVAATLGLGAYWFKIQGLPIPGQAQATRFPPTAAVAERVSTVPDSSADIEATTEAPKVTSAPDRATPVPTTAARKVRSATSGAVPARLPPARQVASAFAPKRGTSTSRRR